MIRLWHFFPANDIAFVTFTSLLPDGSTYATYHLNNPKAAGAGIGVAFYAPVVGDSSGAAAGSGTIVSTTSGSIVLRKRDNPGLFLPAVTVPTGTVREERSITLTAGVPVAIPVPPWGMVWWWEQS